MAATEKPPPRNDWRTPDALWSTLTAEYRFGLDAAADVTNAKCAAFMDGTEGRCGLRERWAVPLNYAVWCNMPYNPKGSVETWLKKALAEAERGVKSVLLVPMATSVAWFNDLVVPFAEWHSFRGRIAFGDPLAELDADGRPTERTSPKQDNLLVIFDPKSNVVGHAAVRDARTGKRLWTRPDLLR